MTADAIAESVAAAMSLDTAAFDERVAEEATFLKNQIDEGVFDNPQAIVGLEHEFFAVERSSPHLRRMPRPLLRLVGFEKELGIHNAEMHTAPQPLNAAGLDAQESEVQARFAAAQRRVRADDIRLVSDGMWTVPPPGESGVDYLHDHVRTGDVVIGTNLSDAVRYHGFANAEVDIGLHVDLPGVDFRAPTAAPAALTQTVQPHFQIPQAVDVPEFFGYAVRIAGPVLAIGVNSPFFPPELYDAGAERILSEGWHENRIPVFEGVMNPVDGPRKVRFPRDVTSVHEAVDRIAADPTLVPADLERVDPDGQFDYHDAFPHFRHKHGSFWRWIRPVFDGASRTEANARIEFRPLPAQPTIPDAITFQGLFGGLLLGLTAADHPVAGLDWEHARDNFYRAARDGIDADLRWITADGRETTESAEVYEELFEFSRRGLERAGLSADGVDEWLDPLHARVRHEVTPASWKRRQVESALSGGTRFEQAVVDVQRAYVDRQQETILDGHFVDWLE